MRKSNLGMGTWVAALLLAGCGDSSTAPLVELFIEGPVQSPLLVGDQVQLEAVLSDPSAPGEISWASSDTAVALVDERGYLKAQRPGTASISARLKKASSSVPVTVLPRTGGYTADEIDYFQEIAFGFEYGSASDVIRKWGENPRLQVFGTPTQEDLTVLDDVILDLNTLMEEVQVELVDSDPTVEVYFAGVSDFPGLLPSYVPGNSGYFSIWFDAVQQIYRSVVLVASDEGEQEDRSHILREEVTQMLGLGRDSWTYVGSIFYQGWTTTQEYDPIDEALIEMLYRPELLRGSAYRPAVDVLRTLTRRGWAGVATPVLGVPEAGAPTPTQPMGLSEKRGRGGTGSGGG